MGERKKDLKKNDIIVYVISSDKYLSRLKKIIKGVSKDFKRICYVSLNKPYETLIKSFKQEKIDSKKFFIIDCVTLKVKKPEGKNHVLYVSSPKALTELNITMNKVLEMGKIDVTIFDSLSTLLVYEGSSTVIKFVHSVISMFRTSKSKGVFTVIKDDASKSLIKDLNMFVDKIVDLG